MRRPIIIGNWKMHGDSRRNERLLRELSEKWNGVHTAEVVVCPPFPYLAQAVRELAHSNIVVGAQDLSHVAEGAYTGDVSGAMIGDMGGYCVIVGHSERRRHHGETDELVARKVQMALDSKLIPIVCVGETLEQREAGHTLSHIEQQLQPALAQFAREQLAASIIAYEPLWAIGTGNSASPEQAQEVHAHIRSQLGSAASQTRVVYGGSVKPDNAGALFAQPDIDGALVGGASLKAKDFLAICRAAE